MINTRWLAAALLGLLSTIAQADETLPRLAISAADLGASDQPQITTAVFADFLNDAGWCQAEAIKAGPGSRWHTPPAAAPPERWVSVATCGYHHRADAYALMFGEGGELTLCAHAAAHKLQSRTGAMLWTQPLAPLASNLKVALRKAELARRDRDRSNNRPKLAIRLVEDTSKPAADSTPRGQLDEAVTLPPEKVLPGIELMALATACEAGFAPTRGEAEQTATLEVAVRDRGCAFRLTLDRAGKKVVLQQQAGWQEYHDVLLRMFQMLRAPEQLADFTRPDRESLQLLASSGQRLFAIVDYELTQRDQLGGGDR